MIYIYSLNLGFLYINFLGGTSAKTPCMKTNFLTSWLPCLGMRWGLQGKRKAELVIYLINLILVPNHIIANFCIIISGWCTGAQSSDGWIPLIVSKCKLTLTTPPPLSPLTQSRVDGAQGSHCWFTFAYDGFSSMLIGVSVNWPQLPLSLNALNDTSQSRILCGWASIHSEHPVLGLRIQKTNLKPPTIGSKIKIVVEPSRDLSKQVRERH